LKASKIADDLAARWMSALHFSDGGAYKVEAYDAIPYNAAVMTPPRRGRLHQFRQRPKKPRT